MKKKIIASLLISILMLTIIVPCFAACSHTYRWVTIRTANCKQTGLKQYKCTKCGRVSSSQTLPKTGCSYVWKNVRPACHESGGLDKQVCSVCGKASGKTRTLAKKAHTMSAWKPSYDPDFCHIYTRECTTCHSYQEEDGLLHSFVGGYCRNCGKPQD